MLPSGRGSSPHRHASDVFGGVSGEVCADRNRRVRGPDITLVLDRDSTESS
jgi:hypothetical protein